MSSVYPHGSVASIVQASQDVSVIVYLLDATSFDVQKLTCTAFHIFVRSKERLARTLASVD
jgi:hypothetical protein